MRVPQSPHNLRKFVSPSSPSSESDSSSDSEKMTTSKKQELRPHFSSHHRSRDRTRISAVQRLVERKLAQKEKDREKERNLMFRRSSSVGSAASAQQVENSSLIRSLSRDRFDSAGKTYITISSGKPTQIRESSPTKRDILSCGTPLKTTKILKDLRKENDDDEAPPIEAPPQRKISFTTEKTIQINAAENPDQQKIMDQKMRKISIDINYVYEQDQPVLTKIIKDDKFVENEKRRLSLEKKCSERRSSSVSSMSTTSSESSFEASSSTTPEPVPRQSKHRRVSSSQVRNINIILEDEISHDSSLSNRNQIHLQQKPKTSFHRRFSQDHTNVGIKNLPPTFQARKISLQDTSTINTDR